MYNINDKSVDHYDKLTTYEGLEHNSKLESLAVPQLIYEI